jgi:hypothetical protein
VSVSTPSNNGRNGLIGAVSSVANGLIGALPPAFLLMCVLNLAFLGLVLWFINSQLDQRVALANKILDHCLAQMTTPGARP